MTQLKWARYIVTLAVMSSAGLATAQQTSNPPSWPVLTLDNWAFQQLVSAGQAVPATLGETLDQDLRQLRADEAHRAIIEGFLRKNANQGRLAMLYRLEPTDPSVHAVPGGDYWSRIPMPTT
jgi:hypothetical protein